MRKKAKESVVFTLEPEDAAALRGAAEVCGISLNRYLKEVVECKAADLRTAETEESWLTRV